MTNFSQSDRNTGPSTHDCGSGPQCVRGPVELTEEDWERLKHRRRIRKLAAEFSEITTSDY